mmetsp:Transcript_41236/g.44772  ORF Transcript_41236/g.44772 Transcript_41236/m.44772 type:complete len:810 (-) Transcript_41236:267-2696(-)
MVNMPPSLALSTVQENIKMEENSTGDNKDDSDPSSLSTPAPTPTPKPPRPPHREVARAVQNLGNTCYMNAVLQALAHAPELCMAMDVQGHRMRCPIYKENAEKIAIRSTARSAASSTTSSRSSSPDIVNNGTEEVKSVYTYSGTLGTAGIRKSSRRPTRSPINTGNDESNVDPNASKFCALCETEQHMDRVHRNNSSNINSSGNTNNKPVAPSDFVHGFIDQVAPDSFRVGQQEDSHEFLRLLIEAVQKSCKQTTLEIKTENTATDQGKPQDTPPEPIPSEDVKSQSQGVIQDGSTGGTTSKDDFDNTGDSDYPFQLFSGKIESKVTCGYCHTTSSTMDPIEDLGLEVTSLEGIASSSVVGGRRNTASPVPTSSLADVSHSLQRFACAEDLDAGYKCEKCGKEGRATKQMRLASVPPILTLHLKRFRYGTSDPSHSNSSGGAGATGKGRGNGHLPTRRSQRSSEVSQLIAISGNSGAAGNDWYVGGKSGSAKIEGPSAFKDVLDLKPYLTEELQKQHAKMYSRLFAVIVHVGKNSHSGHYLAYVRNISKNEWWKMDDARVSLVSSHEVFSAEAYMLFYRVVNHPYSKKLADQVKALNESYDAADAKEKVEKAKEAAEVTAPTASTVTAIKIEKDTSTNVTQSKNNPSVAPSTQGTSTVSASGPAVSVKKNPRKRKAPEFTCGEEWARTKTIISEKNIARFRDVEAKVSKFVKFTPEFNKLLTEHASKSNAKCGHGPSSGVSLVDDCGTSSTEDVRFALLKCFLVVSKNDDISSFVPSIAPMTTRSTTSSRVKLESSSAVHVVALDDDIL